VILPARWALLIAVAAAVSCSRDEPAREQVPWNPVAADAKPIDESHERSSLIGVSRGSTVVDRTGEALFDVSALNAIDDDPGSFWMSPPQDLPQTITIALGARSRIQSVGIRTVTRYFTANHVQFETSADGRAWQALTVVKAADSNDAQWFNVTPIETSFLRVTAVDGAQPKREVRLSSILARGKELEPALAGAIEGCWSINGRAASFNRSGANIVGSLAIGNLPLFLDGGSDGRVYRFTWVRGNDYGLALVGVSPDGEHLSAMDWHEEAIPMFFAEPWFGERGKCAAPLPRTDVALALLRRVGRYSVFGLRFQPDDSLDLKASAAALLTLHTILSTSKGPARLIAHEFREASPVLNKARSQRELDALRNALQSAGANLSAVSFVAAGSEAPRQNPVTEAMRAIYSSVDFEMPAAR
jgi:hypothetical protein